MNFLTAFLCCAAAVRAMAGARRTHCQRRHPPGAGMAAGRGHGGLYRKQSRRRRAHGRIGRGGGEGWHSGQCDCASTMDTPANRKAMPNADHAAWAKVEDVAATIVFLASPENRVTRGAWCRFTEGAPREAGSERGESWP